MKTAFKHFEILPTAIRRKAFKNANNRNMERKLCSEALACSFLWDETTEGFKYWEKIYNDLKKQAL